MKFLVDVADSKADVFMKLIKEHCFVQARHISAVDADLLEEIRQIKKAFKNAENIKDGKLKGRLADDLLLSLK